MAKVREIVVTLKAAKRVIYYRLDKEAPRSGYPAQRTSPITVELNCFSAC